MENASKALIMATEILIGIMIISIGVYLFNTVGKYSADTTAKMEETQIAQFNEQFLNFFWYFNFEVIPKHQNNFPQKTPSANRVSVTSCL